MEGESAESAESARQKNDIRIVRILRNLTFLSANFYTSSMTCRAMDERRRKRGVSYPPYMADAKEETPRQRKGKIVITGSRDWVITKGADNIRRKERSKRS